ncbi:Calcium uniporter protein [Heracleum sosnowskyi]|uniref:Calcium uniporter protein n=1 Tax=Heracleum sosnowskyi TaxID=360622 RepID=A0AAD8MS80_9APIA|nr:Calcium uniporter protein [Heracleum sosnowskyi]
MAFNKMLIQRIFNMSKTSHQTLTSCRISSSAVSHSLRNDKAPAIDPGDVSLFRRLMRSPAPELPYFGAGERLIEKLRGMDIGRDRIRLDGLSPPAAAAEARLTAEDARKLMKVAQIEMVKEKIKKIGKSCVSYEEFVKICVEGAWSEEQGFEIAKMLDESGNVFVFGKVVFLRPDQVAKAIHGLMPAPVAHPEDPRRKELEILEEQKYVIDKKAESLVRRELWCGLAFLMVQTAGFMRLTFWELSWDVMEPICFYVTSMYFMAGYTFFLRTAKEPSFEGFFQSRFSTKQKKLMKANKFDLQRYNELREACYPHPWPREKSATFGVPDDGDNSETMESGPSQQYNLR